MSKIQLVPQTKVLSIMEDCVKKVGNVSRTESQIIDALIAAFPEVVMVEGKKYLNYQDVSLFIDNWVKALQTKDFNFLTQRRGLRCEPVSMEEFVCSPDYLSQASQIRPAIKKEILRLYEEGSYFNQVILTGATGIGKDYFAYLVLARTLYELWCYYNPQVEFGLAAGTSIVLAIQSITKDLAKKVTFDELVGTVLSPSRFFQNHFLWDRTVTSELRFPGNIFVRPLSGEDTSALGMAIFSCFPGDFEYVTASGEYAQFSEQLNVPIMTYSDTEGYYPTESSVPSVITGYNREVIRLWFGDDYIDCTPDQQFKNVNGDWVYAEECGNHRIISCALSDMSNSSVPWALCTKTERLNSFCTVYDVINVPKTNTLIVPTRNRKFHLVAHNSIINEMNFMSVVSKSKKIAYAANQEYNQAIRIYKTLSRRIKGRFNKYGKVPGKLLLISSANKQGDFISKLVDEVKLKGDPHTFIMSMSQWESFDGLDRVSSETFLVEKGDDTKQSRIIASMDEALNPEDVIKVPIDYKDDFEKDIDGALADIAGESISGGRKKFIPYKEDIVKAREVHKSLHEGKQLFLSDSIIMDRVVDVDAPDFSKVVDMEYVQNMMTPNAKFALHIDYGFTGDATGIAIGHVSGIKLIQKARVYDPITNGYREIENQHLPEFFIDGVMAVRASSGSEVDIDFVENLVIFLKGFLNIQWVTFDSYESRSSIQTFKKLGMISGVVSTVSDNFPYAELKNAIKTNRIYLPDSQYLVKEILELERLPNGKIDHPSQGSKDIADAVAGVVSILLRKDSPKATGGVRQVSRPQGSAAIGRQSLTRKSRFERV